MQIDQLNETLISFWDKQFEVLKATVIKKEDFLEPSTLLEKLKYVGDHSETILDFGCGSGYALFYLALFGEKIKKGFGIDTSRKAIEYARQTKDMSELNLIEFKVGNHLDVKKLENNTFDGVICSNVLDVVPYDTSSEMIEILNNVLKPGGLFLLKLNFYLTEDLIKKINMKEIDKHTYEINGVLRGMNLTTEAWISRFENFELLEIDEYQRVEKGPKDRILLMRKKD